jgi:formamidopyrimidine-DNA glycosylase
MPELPEVETMVRDLASRVTGRTITRVDAPFEGSVVWPSFAEFEQRAVGQTIERISRRGKWAIFGLSSGDLLAIHRGMTGSLLLRSPHDERESHLRVIFGLDDGSELRFNDPRKFGKVLVMDAAGAERPFPWSRMGPEPLDGDFSLQSFQEALQGRKGLIKPLLLGQHLVAGLGNIYVDEALYRARIHPERRANTLGADQIGRLHAAIREVLRAAIEGRGTTFSSYTDIEGRQGQYQDDLQVFGRAGSACRQCGSPIVRLVVSGRGTHICPECQRV